MNNAMGLIGLAKRAGKLAIGEESCGIAVRDKKARALFTASDASARTKAWAEQSGVPHIPLPSSKAELGHLLGRASCAQFALLDVGIAASVVQKLAVDDPTYAASCEILTQQALRAAKRKEKKRSRKG